jgi:hypothetical protein
MHWAAAVVSESLRCQRCGYDLRGLAATGKCPECGLDIWTSVLFTVDPDSSRLRTLHNPKAVGNAVLILAVCLFAGSLLMIGEPLALMLGYSSASPRLPALVGFALNFGWLHATALTGLGWWALWLLKPASGSVVQGAVWIDLWRIGLGITGWAFFAAWWIQYEDALGAISSRERLILRLASGVCDTIALVGLRGVFGVVGERSREYRRSKGGRQSVDVLIATIVAGMIAALVRHLTYYTWVTGELRGGLRTLGTVVLWISTFMVLVGLAYLVVNAWWIRQSLCRPAPPLDQVLMPKLSDDTWIPDREE